MQHTPLDQQFCNSDTRQCSKPDDPLRKALVKYASSRTPIPLRRARDVTPWQSTLCCLHRRYPVSPAPVQDKRGVQSRTIHRHEDCQPQHTYATAHERLIKMHSDLLMPHNHGSRRESQRWVEQYMSAFRACTGPSCAERQASARS